MELRGYSGCRVELVTDRDLIFVRKTSKSIDYNQRLQKQAMKQQNFICNKYFTTPIILGEGFINNLYYFDMEYVRGKTAADYFKTLEIYKIREFCEALTSVVDQSKKEMCSFSVIKEKIEKLKIVLPSTTVIVDALKILENYHWGNVENSTCHGDLTLNNIIISKDGFYLIDFLDSFCESWMIDVAKLLQDIEIFWAYRNSQKIDENLNVRILIANNLLMNKLHSMKNGKSVVTTVYYFLLLNLLRIIPYTKIREDLLFLENKIKEVIKLL